MTESLMCCGSREWNCWNSVGFNGEFAARRMMEAVTTELYNLDGFDNQFSDLVKSASQDHCDQFADRRQKLKRDEESLAQSKENILAGIAQYGPRPMFEQKLQELDAKARELAHERITLDSVAHRLLKVPSSVLDLRHMLEEQFQKLAVTSPEFGDLMRKLVPEFHVYLVRLCHGGHLLPRARIKLTLDGLTPDAQYVPGLSPMLTRYLTIDLFQPTQRERIRNEAVKLATMGLGQKEIADRIAEKPTSTAVGNALALDRKMRELGLANPYITVNQPPAEYTKLRHHLNPKYRFEPLDGYLQPAI